MVKSYQILKYFISYQNFLNHNEKVEWKIWNSEFLYRNIINFINEIQLDINFLIKVEYFLIFFK